MVSNDFDRPPAEDSANATMPPNPQRARTTWTGPVGMVIAILFVILVLVTLAG